MLRHALKHIDEHLEGIFLVVLIALMSIIIGVQVFMRYVIQASLSWSEEIARYMFIWLTYIGISYGVKTRRHIKVDAALLLLSDKKKNIVYLLSDLIFLVFAVIVVLKGVQVAQLIIKLGQYSPALGIPMGYVYIAPVVGFSMVCVRLVQNIYFRVKTLREGDV